MRNRPWMSTLLLLVVTSGASAADSPPSNREQRLRELMAEFGHSISLKDPVRAEQICRDMIALAPEMPTTWFNLSCTQARQGKTDAALDSLTKSVELGMLEPALLRKDPDLESLRTQERFQQCLAKARKNQLAAPYEKGGAIKGLKTEERYPEEGLRYRLRLPPDVTEERPCRLVVWMHPSGGSMNAEVERLAPMLAGHRFALMVFTRKQFSLWAAQEIEPMKKSIADAADIPGLTVERPILMGFSAGGQVALQLWHKDPGGYGGLVLDAAYPIDHPTYNREKRMVLANLPESPAIAEVPLFVVVGDQDGGSRLWKQADTAWRAAGVPLTLRLVPGQKHAWLIQGKEQEALDHWLRDLAAGRLPDSTPAHPEVDPNHRPPR